MRSHGTAQPSPTTPADRSRPDASTVVQIEKVTDEHRGLFVPLLDRFAYIAAVHRSGQLSDVLVIAADDIDALSALREHARDAAKHGWTYGTGCGWCGIACPPAERVEHKCLVYDSDMTYRARWTA
jgi:hypothetical protein